MYVGFNITMQIVITNTGDYSRVINVKLRHVKIKDDIMLLER